MPSSSRGKGRRTVNEINMVPFIDVMLVLLIIFMVTAPMLTPGAINVPSTGKSEKAPTKAAQVLLDENGTMTFKSPEGDEQAVTVKELGAIAKSWQEGRTDETAVVIYADKKLPYESVTNALSALHSAGVKRAALGVTSAAGK